MAGEDDQDGIWIDGTLYTDDDLTYAEQHEMRRIIHGFHQDDPAFQPGDAAVIDIVPALVTVVKRRDDPKFKVEDALAVKPSELRKPGKNGRRPTSREK